MPDFPWTILLEVELTRQFQDANRPTFGTLQCHQMLLKLRARANRWSARSLRKTSRKPSEFSVSPLVRSSVLPSRKPSGAIGTTSMAAGIPPHVASFGAMLDGKLVGSTFATKWGSVGFLGPITVHPDRHEGGIGRALLAETMRQFDDWGARHVGLFTFAHSAKHVALYQKYDFYARFLTAIMSAPVGSRQKSAALMRFSGLSTAQQREALHSCRNVADALYAGLDLTEEIRATNAQGVGDTILIEGGGGIVGFAVCHYGPRSEAAPTIASLNSVRCATAPRPNRIIFACSTHARLWRSRLACPTCWRVRTWRATRPTAILSRADFARQFRASPCTGTMTPAIVGPVPTSSTIGVNRSSSICRF